ncbi:MAG TPA: TRAM domain-containing protein [Streptosporangiaceae bacterium]|nr:TRAM domain-containing protein [Streptosporangiaceae bacterium]
MTASAPRLPQPGDVVELTMGEVAHGGWCVARTDAGPVVFVRHALPGERVRAVITQTTSRFARADATQILDASADRVQPPCPYAVPGGCGGCDWQHAALPAQRALKAAVIGQQLRRIAGIERDVTVEPMPGDETGLGWRTRVKFAVGRGGVAGLRRHRSHELMEIGDCLIAHPLIETAAVTGRRWPGAASVEVAVAPASGERALAVSGRRAAQRGPAHLRQRAAGRDWRVSATGFWQVHPAAAGTLAAAVLDALRPRPGDVALDLYCGAGLFAGVLADAVGPSGAVIGIEADADAVRDARHNVRGTRWARVYRGDAAALLERNRSWAATLAVVDPPRTGLTREVVGLLSEPGGVGRVAYVSCDPATLARDLAAFGASGWELEALRAFDAFPMTHHVECLATLTHDW